MQILNSGRYNYVEQCDLKGLAHTRESHVVTSSVTYMYSKQQVCSPPTRVHRLKLRRDRHHHHHGLLTPQQLAGSHGMLCQQQSKYAYTALVPTVKTIRRVIIISLVRKNATNTI